MVCVGRTKDKKKQGRAVKSCTTLLCLENGVKYKGGVYVLRFFVSYLKKKKNRINYFGLFLYGTSSDPPTNQYL